MPNNSLNLAIRQASRNLSVKQDIVEAVYRSYWGFIRQHIEGLPLLDMSEEEFNAADTNFNIPYIGKLYVNYEKIEKFRKHLKIIQDAEAKKNQANRLPGAGD